MPARPEFGKPVEADYGALALLNLTGSLETEDIKWEQAKDTYGHGYIFDNMRRITLRLRSLLSDEKTKQKVLTIASAADIGPRTAYASLVIERAYPNHLPNEINDGEVHRIKSTMGNMKEEIFGNRDGGNYTDLFSNLMRNGFNFNNPDQIDLGLV